jgi:hypothetical protein
MRPVRAAPMMAWMALSFIRRDHHLDLDLGQKVDGVFAAAIELGVALLAAMAAGFENGHAFDARFEQGILDCVQLGGLENGFDLEHVQNASFDSVTGGAVVGLLRRILSWLNSEPPPRLITSREFGQRSRSLLRRAARGRGRRLRLGVDAQAHHLVDDEEQHQRADDGDAPGDGDAGR